VTGLLDGGGKGAVAQVLRLAHDRAVHTRNPADVEHLAELLEVEAVELPD
jgi:hypothetical protein